MKFMGMKGYGITVTCRRDCFPMDTKQYLHREKNKPGDEMAKTMRYENPIVGVRQVKATKVSKSYTENIVSFQSTEPTNISGVNNLPSLQLYVTVKVRGRGGEKRVWAIEQNEAQETYLNHYFGTDVANHMIKNTANKYITWKYWRAPYLHAQSMGIVAAYDMYKECCDGLLGATYLEG
jgi:hypothetical protein